MKSNNILHYSVLVLVLTACNNDKVLDENVPDKQVEICLSSSLDVMTRANYTPTQSKALAIGDTVYAWVDNVVGPSTLYNAWELKSDASGNLDKSVTTDGIKYYPPTSDGKVDIYALHGNFKNSTPVLTKETSAYPTNTFTYRVLTDQINAGKYEISDLLYAKATGLGRLSSRQMLSFYHMLSKIEVGLIEGDGSPDLTDAQIDILNTIPQANITLAKGTAANAYNTTQIVVDNSIDVSSIKMRLTGYDATENGGVMITNPNSDPVVTQSDVKVFGEAVVIPQTITASTDSKKDFIKITLKDGGVLTAKLSANKSFAPYTKYIYTVTVGLTELSVKSTIVDWNTDETITSISAEW